MKQTQVTPPPPAALPMQMDVRIHSLYPGGAILANASVTLNGCFAVRGIRIMNGSKGPFVSMPSYKAEGTYKDICFPCTKEFHQQFHQAVLTAYQQALTQQYARQQQPALAQPQQAQYHQQPAGPSTVNLL